MLFLYHQKQSKAQAGKGDSMTAIIASRKNKFETYVIERVQTITYVERDLIITYLDDKMEVHTSHYESLDIIVSIA